MDNNSDEQLLIMQAKIEANMQATIEPNRKDTDETLKNLTEDVTMITSTIKSMMDQNNNMKSSPSQKDTSNPTDPTTVVPANRRD